MKPYSSASGKKSGVSAFEIGDDFIIVRFRSDEYKYSFKSCGKQNTEIMKRLALASKGLSGFISQKYPGFEWKR